jgi:hypothetical protein
LYAKYAGLLFNPDRNHVAKAMLEWMRAAISDPAMLSCVLFAANLHLGLVQGTFRKTDHEDLKRKAVAYRRIRQVISDEKTAIDFNTIYMILQLAIANDAVISKTGIPRGYAPFNPPLTTLQWLNVYGSAVPIPAHMKAIAALIQTRGGVKDLEASGLAKGVS